MRRFIFGVFEVLEVALIAIGAVILIRNFLIQPFLVSGTSMAPNFHDGDYLLVDELVYRFREPVRGEVAVFRYPNSEERRTFFIKRIIGLPGERVLVKNNTVTVFSGDNGVMLTEEYLASGLLTSGNSDVTLKESEFFVLGDNRSFSFDSRQWGPLPRSNMVGLVRLRLWPLGSIRAFAAPSYP